MPRLNLTNRTLQSLKPVVARVDYFDKGLPGFCVRVTSQGLKTFAVMYRHAGRLRRLTIGRYPPLSLADARNEAREALRQAALGNDPATLKQQERQAGTFGELAREYMKRWAKKKKRSWLADQQLLERCLLPWFKNVRASEVSRKDARALLGVSSEAHGLIQVRRVHPRSIVCYPDSDQLVVSTYESYQYVAGASGYRIVYYVRYRRLEGIAHGPESVDETSCVWGQLDCLDRHLRTQVPRASTQELASTFLTSINMSRELRKLTG